MNRRSFAGLAAIACAAAPAAAAAQSRERAGTRPGAAPASPPSRPTGVVTVEWEGFTFDVEPPLTAYCVERCEYLDERENIVRLVVFIPGEDPVGPIEMPARDRFDLQAGDALGLGSCGVANGG